MFNRKSKQIRPVSESQSSQPPAPLDQEKQEGPTFTEIGGSPVPGLTLRYMLHGHNTQITNIKWFWDSERLISTTWGSPYKIILWDLSNPTTHTVLGEHSSSIWVASITQDGFVVTGSGDHKIVIWDPRTIKKVLVLEGHTDGVQGIASVANAEIISGAMDGSLRIWDRQTGAQLDLISNAHGPGVGTLLLRSEEQLVSCGSNNVETSIKIWDIKKRLVLSKLDAHKNSLRDLSISSDGNLLASADADGLILIWDLTNNTLLRKLEGHTDEITSISFSSNDQILASKSKDGTVRLWRCDTWETVFVLCEAFGGGYGAGLAFHPRRANFLATLGEKDTAIRIWDINYDVLLSNKPFSKSVYYTTAKLVLVGDSGVGKTGLGWRLAHGEFREQASTHGQQFWPIPQLGLKRKDGTECEAVLWDLAGQHVYRQIHSIFLENVAAALVVFDPSNRQDPLKGAQFWLEQLKGKGQLPPAVLVGARVDRGAPAVSQQELEQFCQRYGIRGGYISTSAKSNEGLENLLEILKAQIPWEHMTTTVTTVTFKRIKDFVLALKEKLDRAGVLVSPLALREQLQATDQGWRFTDAEMMTAVQHLETHGYVAVLRSSAGEQHILLTPDLLVTLASSIVLLADKHPRELGAVSETELLQGEYPFEELAGLSPAESQILLDAAILRFLEHNISFRETLDNDTLLIFPSLIKQKRPLQDDLPSSDDISYVVRGRVENLYASLVVLLGYTPSFTRINQWQNQAQYEMGEGEICGFRLIEDREGEIELVLYYSDEMPASGRVKFQELSEQFLYQRDVEITPFPPVVCVNGHQQKRSAVMEAVREGLLSLFCYRCGKQTDLPNLEQSKAIGIGASPWLQREEAAARLRSKYEVQLTSIKSYRRGWATPRCYISRVDEQSEWAKETVGDLRDAGVYVVEQATQVESNDFVVVLDTPAYQKSFKSGAPVLSADIPLINARLGNRQLISLALTGLTSAHEFKGCNLGSFSDETHYPVSLFDLVLNLYAIPLTHPGFAPLRQGLHEQWEHTLSARKGEDPSFPLKVFISYSHKDEEFKNELGTMLAGLQRRGIVDAWEDRRIEAGDEWNQSIQDAMNECDLAILLVSADYLASRFIQEDEQPRLLQRRQDLQLRVIPIIVRPCPWQSEAVLKDLQALPRDNKPVITFSKTTGARDQVWTDIATVIEERAKAKTG